MKKASCIFRRSLLGLLLMAAVTLTAPSAAAAEQAQVEIIERNTAYAKNSTVTSDYRVTQGTVDLKGKTLTVTGDFFLDNGTVKLSGGTLNIVGNLYVTGDLYVSNGKLNVGGSVIHKGGKIDIGMGSLTVEDSYYLATPKTNEADELIWDSSRGTLVMRWPADKLTVKGDFYANAVYGVDCTAGTLTVGGDFSQISDYKPQRFLAGKKHKVVLNGTEPQTVTFQSSDSSFGRLEVTNPTGIIVTDHFSATELTSANREVSIQADNASFGNLTLNVPKVNIQGTVWLRGNVNLRYYTLNISGDLIHTDGHLNTEWGILDIGGNYYQAIPQSDEEGAVTWTSSRSTLAMCYPRSTVNVGGNFCMNAGKISTFTAGKLTVSGDFIQMGDYTPREFTASNTHRVILNGKENQTLTLECGSSGFAVLEVSNPTGITVTDYLRANSLVSPTGEVKLTSQDAVIEGLNLDARQLTVTGNLTQEGDIHLKSGTMTVDGDLRVVFGEIKKYSGKLDVTGQIIPVTTDHPIQAEPDMDLPIHGNGAAGVDSLISSNIQNYESSTKVWISSDGAKYHRDSSCSNMQNPEQVTLEQAKQQGRSPCEKCS